MSLVSKDVEGPALWRSSWLQHLQRISRILQIQSSNSYQLHLRTTYIRSLEVQAASKN